MKVLMTSTSFPENRQDWRGRFIADLVDSLGSHTNIELSLWAPPGETSNDVRIATSPDDQAWLRNLAKRGGIAHLLRSDKPRAVMAVAGLLRRLRKVYCNGDSDLVHVNWIQNALPLWGTSTPALISVLGADFGLLRLPGMRALLRLLFRQRRAILTPNAEWMVQPLQRAFGDTAEIQTVPFGIGDRWFSVQRQIVGNAPHRWLAVTRLTANKIGDLLNWGETLFGTHRELHLFGPMQEQIALPGWIKYHGPTHPVELSEVWFPVATGLITLSRHDEGRPQVVLEAMASGLPVIASGLPAHRDIIEHTKTGWIAESQVAFGRGLTCLEKASNNLQIGSAAREWVMREIGSWNDCASRYVSLYAKLLKH